MKGGAERDSTPSALTLRRACISHAGGRLFAPLECTVEAGEILTVMGPSGMGKSSLLSAICGTLDPDLVFEGDVLLGGKSLAGIPPERRGIGILFQDDLLFPHLSVGENLGFGLKAGGGRRHRLERIERALVECELEGFAGRDPATLSGGQKARVSLMRVLLSEPAALLLDEPFGKLDQTMRDRFRYFVLERTKAAMIPVILVTHDLEDAQAMGGKIVTLTALSP